MVLLAFAVSTCVAVVPAPAGATFPGKAGRIAFSAEERSGVLYDYDPRTGAVRKLTRVPVGCRPGSWFDSTPEYAPGGRLLAYLHSDDCAGAGTPQTLWLMRPDGSRARMLASFVGVGGVSSIAFSPSGRRIAALAIPENLPEPGRPTRLVVNVRTGAVTRSGRWPYSFWEEASIDWGTAGHQAIGTARTAVWAFRPGDEQHASALTSPRTGRTPGWFGADFELEFQPKRAKSHILAHRERTTATKTRVASACGECRVGRPRTGTQAGAQYRLGPLACLLARRGPHRVHVPG